MNRATDARAAKLRSPKTESVVDVMEAVPGKLTAKTWQAYRDALYGFVRRRVDDPAAAEDIVQDVLVKAYTQRDTLRQPSRLRSWLFQITRNAIADHYRVQKRPEPVAEDLVQKDGAEDEEHAARELSQCLFPLLATLPTPYRQALELADVERLKQREVATRLGLSLSGAKSRVQRARGLLRDALLNCCSVELDRRGHAMDYRTANGCDERQDR